MFFFEVSFFTSQRLKAAYPFGMQNARVYRLPLEKLDEPYRIDKFNELFKEEKKRYFKKEQSHSTGENDPAIGSVTNDRSQLE